MTTEEAIEAIERVIHTELKWPGTEETVEALELAIATLRAQQERKENPGEVSDGYHTFNELYHHRAVLFSVICHQFPDRAWKSLQHDNPNEPMYEGMFIVGIDTPEGQATYHYDVGPYWDMFRVKELDRALKWDGHTPAEAIRRIGTLAEAEKNEPLTGWISVKDRLPEAGESVLVYRGPDTLMNVDYMLEPGLWGADSYYDDEMIVTHWMPMPEPPKEDSP